MASDINSSIDKAANGLAGDLIQFLYKNQLAALRNTLTRFHIPDYHYTLFDIRDESTCLNYNEGAWLVFFSERGLQTNLKISHEIEGACANMLYEMADSKEEYEQMLAYYRKELENLSADRFSSRDFYLALKDGLKKYGNAVAF